MNDMQIFVFLFKIAPTPPLPTIVGLVSKDISLDHTI